MFINEWISDDDRVKYSIEEIDAKLFGARTSSRGWTIDRERDMYLRNVTGPGRECERIPGWTFLWNGHLLWLDIILKDAGGMHHGPTFAHYQLVRMSSYNQTHLDPELESQRDQIIVDLKEALLAYKDGGMYATSTGHTLTFEECPLRPYIWWASSDVQHER